MPQAQLDWLLELELAQQAWELLAMVQAQLVDLPEVPQVSAPQSSLTVWLPQPPQDSLLP